MSEKTEKEVELELKVQALLEDIARLSDDKASLRVSFTRLSQVAEQLQEKLREYESAEKKTEES